jgi:hypothetical protein
VADASAFFMAAARTFNRRLPLSELLFTSTCPVIFLLLALSGTNQRFSDFIDTLQKCRTTPHDLHIIAVHLILLAMMPTFLIPLCDIFICA